MGNVFYFEWENALILFIQAHMGAFGTALVSFFTMFGEELILTGLFMLVYFVLDKKAGAFIGTNMLLSMNLNAMLKNIFLRLRPYIANKEIKCLKPVDKNADIYDIAAQGYSFPSGHSANAANFYTAMAVYWKKRPLYIAAAAAMLLVGVARFSLGVHYPTDVLCGWALGLLTLGLVLLLQKVIRKKWVLYLIIVLISLPGLFYVKSDDYYASLGMTIGFFAGDLFEERFVGFKNTRNIFRGILRILLGVGLYLGLNKVLKMPFSKEFLSSGTTAAHLVRTARYGITVFLIAGIFPFSFRILDKWEEKKKAKGGNENAG